MSAGNEIEPKDARRTATTGRVRASSLKRRSASESTSASILFVEPLSSISPTGVRALASNKVAVNCTESAPLPTRAPNTASRAPVRCAASVADAASARPLHWRITTEGSTVRKAPAPSSWRDKRSTIPSRQSSSFGSSTSNGVMATRFGSRVDHAPARHRRKASTNAPMATVAPATVSTRRAEDRRVGELLRNHAPHIRAGVRRLASQHLVQHASQTVDVAPAIEPFTLRSLLRAHVARRPDGDPSLGQRTGRSCRDRPRDPEVADDGMPGLEQDILGLDVPMYDVVAVGVAQCVRHLASDL